MKQIIILLALLFLCSCSLSIAGGKNSVVEKKTIAIAEKPEWKMLYYKELLRSIALEYTGLCFKDKRWINANQEIEKLDIEIKQRLNNTFNLEEK